jgi:hypothetical protein
VKVRCDEGIAIRIGPAPCVSDREVWDEASAGGRAGQPLSRESEVIPGADVLAWTEGHTNGGVIVSPRPARRGRRTWHARKLFVREPGDLSFIRGACAPDRVGKARSRSRR